MKLDSKLMMGCAGFLLLTLPVYAEKPFTLKATLTGAAEVPGPGATDATGTVVFTLETGKICYEVSLKGLSEIAAAHIHSGAAGTAGPVVLALDLPKVGEASKSCTPAPAELLVKLGQSPGDYYYNVHTAALKAGALRGQLAADAM
jgi:hypothetical protein